MLTECSKTIRSKRVEVKEKSNFNEQKKWVRFPDHMHPKFLKQSYDKGKRISFRCMCN
jgi:hypothetical protein